MNFFGNFLKKEDVSFKELLAAGATIIDVRSEAEFESGHIDGAINIPLDILPNAIKNVGTTEDTFIICCASGGRSAVGTHALHTLGYTHVYNGGGYRDLQKKI